MNLLEYQYSSYKTTNKPGGRKWKKDSNIVDP